MMIGFRYTPDECTHEHGDVIFVEVHRGQFEPRVTLCPDCGIGCEHGLRPTFSEMASTTVRVLTARAS